MKKKNGFTLVELLAVIVVLAIIMIIAIPTVLDVMNNARKSSFVLYAEKVINAVQTQYLYDAGLGSIAGAGYYVYDITSDLELTSTGDYRGYVVVNAIDVDNVEYILFLYDNNYMITNHNVTQNGMPTTDNGSIAAYDASFISSQAASSAVACQAAAGSQATCYNRNGYIIVSAN